MQTEILFQLLSTSKTQKVVRIPEKYEIICKHVRLSKGSFRYSRMKVAMQKRSPLTQTGNAVCCPRRSINVDIATSDTMNRIMMVQMHTRVLWADDNSIE